MIRRPVVILALFTALNLLNYLDRFVVAAVLDPIQSELHLSGLAAGALANVFMVSYFATSPFFGSRGDQGSRKGLIALGIAVWSAATIASGLARGFGSLLVARAFVGVGEASYATLAPTIIDDVAPPAQKSRWLAIFFAAIPIGSALGYIVGGHVLSTHGWRAAFFVAGGPGLILSLLCLLVAEPARRTLAERAPILPSARTLFAIPLFRDATLGYAAYTFAIGGFGYWAPKYLHVRYGIEAGKASQTFGALTVVGGAIGTLAGGWIADRLAARRLRRLEQAQGAPLGERERDDAVTRTNLLVCAATCAVGAPLAALAIASGSAHGFFGAVLPCETAIFLSTGPISVALLRSSPPALRASAMALNLFAIHALGDLWSPLLIGFATDHAPMTLAMTIVPVVFAIAAIVWWKAAGASARLTATAGVR